MSSVRQHFTRLAVLLLAVPFSSFCCSVAGCLNDGPEFAPDFVVAVKCSGKPLRGVRIQITGSATVEAVTDAKGKTTIPLHRAGTYWLSADFLGTEVAYECFHIAPHHTRKAKRTVRYEWGDDGPTTRQVAGNIIDVQHAHGGTPLWNASHYANTPVSDADLQLRNVFTGEVSQTKSNSKGIFAFSSVPKGFYVLQVRGETSAQGREFIASTPVKVNPTSLSSGLTVTRTSGWDCGDGTLIQVKPGS